MTAPLHTDAAGATGRVPDFFVVGHPKSGTTALYEMLRRHPQIFMPDVKEPRFFDSDHRELAGGGGRSLAEYLELFSGASAHQRAGEASPSYLRSRVAAAAIAELQPAARCIAIFREPASFLRSVHLQLVQEHIERETDFARALANEEVTRENGERVLRYSERIRYVEQLRRFHEAFPREQVLALIYDDLRRDNEGTLRTVLRFLGVDDEVAIETVDANPTVAMRAPAADRALRELQAGRGLLTRAGRGAIRTLTPRAARRRALRTLRGRVIYREPDPPDERLMLELRRRFSAEVKDLGEYLGRDLASLWGYEELL
jgi:Sulfotransferase domain